MSQTLFYRIEGEGEPIVLLHGFLASSHYFKQLIKKLSRDHKVIAIDLLGFGRSPKPKEADYTYDEHVARVHATLQKLGVSHFTVVGHSLGALIALRYSRTYPSEVQRLILLNPPMYRGPQDALATLQNTGLHYRVLLHSPWRDLLWYSARLLPRFPFNKRRPSINLTDVIRAGSAARKRTYENIILRGQFFDDIQHIAMPTILVMGKRDRAAYHRNAAHWNPPQNVCCVSVATGHHMPIQRPLLAEKLVRFALLY